MDALHGTAERCCAKCGQALQEDGEGIPTVVCGGFTQTMMCSWQSIRVSWAFPCLVASQAPLDACAYGDEIQER